VQEFTNNVKINYTQIPNKVINDDKLDWNAKGMFCYLASKPTGWKFYETEIAEHSPKGLASAKGAIQKLIDAGYLIRTKAQNDKGQFVGWKYELVSTRHSKNPITEKPNIGKTNTNNTNSSNTEYINDTKVSLAKAEYGKPDINEMFTYWHETIGYPIDSKVQINRNACSNLIKKHGVDKLKQLVGGVAIANQDPYAPRIADFSELQFNLNKLMAWGRKRQTSQSKGVIRV
jgi:hypothetical protein